jgi:predicted DNA-binding protein
MADKRELTRVNTRISVTANQWLDNHSDETGMAKSTIIMLAIENYIREKEALKAMVDIGAVYEKLQELERKIQ